MFDTPALMNETSAPFSIPTVKCIITVMIVLRHKFLHEFLSESLSELN